MSNSTPLVLRPGDVFRGRYRVVHHIKAGGMGSVYEVRDETTNRPRALKVMLPSLVEDADMRARFALEARVTGDIESDHLVRISDVGIDEASGAPFMVMDLLRGEDLQTSITKRGSLPPEEVLACVAQTGWVLDKTHAAGIVHRDIKPDNLFITRRDDGSPCVKILDFGIAKIIVQQQAKKTRALGTPLYMAPEQVRGDGLIGPRADLYSLAHVAYTLLTGEAYWAEDAKTDESLVGVLMKILAGAQEPPSARAWRRRGASLGPDFDAWFRRATAPHAEHRFESAAALTAELTRALKAQPGAPTAMPAALNVMPVGPSVMHTGQAPIPAAQVAMQSGQVAAQTAPSGYPMVTGPVPGQVPYYAAQPPGPGGPYGAFPHQNTSAPLAAPMPAFPAQAAPKTPVALVGAIVGGLGLIGLLGGLGLYCGLQPSNGGAATPSSCGPALACAPTRASDPAHADAIELLQGATALARKVDSDAKLVMIFTGAADADGSVNLTANQAIIYTFAVPKGTLSVSTQDKMTYAVLTVDSGMQLSPIPDPKCSMKRLVNAGIRAGVPSKGPISLFYRHVLPYPAPSWMVYSGTVVVELNPQTCESW